MTTEVRCGGKREVAAFILSKLPFAEALPVYYEALGAYNTRSELIGGVLYTNYQELAGAVRSIDMHIAGQPGWLTRRTIRAFFDYPFNQLECSRIVAPIYRENKHTQSLANRLGCKLDGILRSGVSPELDMFVYTMTKKECLWI